VTCKEDLSRDILKSETAAVSIPEKDIQLLRGTMGGKFTTVEGLLLSIRDDLARVDPFVLGDSVVEERKQKFRNLIQQLEKLSSGNEFPFTIIMEDPVANSYVQSFTAPEPDPNLTIDYYERSWEENEDLGINSMQTEDY